MPKLEYFLVCESISIDKDTNRISLFNVLEDFQIASIDDSPAPAFLLNQFVAVALLHCEDGDENQEFEAKVQICVKEKQFDHSMTFSMEKKQQRIIMRFIGMPPMVNDGNELVFKLLINNQPFAHHTVRISKLQSD